MSFQSIITCPDCGHPIHIDSQLLLSGASFSCSNEVCSASISLAADDKETVNSAFTKFEAMKVEAQNASAKYE